MPSREEQTCLAQGSSPQDPGRPTHRRAALARLAAQTRSEVYYLLISLDQCDHPPPPTQGTFAHDR